MTIRDMRSNIAVDSILDVTANTAASIQSDIYDTKSDEALMFLASSQATTAASMTLSAIQESDNSDMSGATNIPENRIIGVLANVSFTSSSRDSKTIGIFSNKRYVRLTFTVTTPGAGNSLRVHAMSYPFGQPAFNSDE